VHLAMLACHHDGSSVDADAHGERLRRGEPSHALDDLEARAHRTFGGVIERLRPPEVDEEPVPLVARDVPTEPPDRRGCHLAVAPDRIWLVSGTEPPREMGGAAQVAEHPRQLPSLAGPRGTFGR